MKEFDATMIQVLLIVLSSALAVIGYFLRDLKKTMISKDAEQDRAIEKLKDEFHNFRTSMPETYVLRQDWIRELTVFQKKIDDQSGKIDGQNTKLIKIAEDVSKLLALYGKERRT